MKLSIIISKIKKHLKYNYISYNHGYDENDKNIFLYSNPNNIAISGVTRCAESSTEEDELMQNISTTSKLIVYKRKNKDLNTMFALDLLQDNMRKISTLRGRPVLAYLCAVNKKLNSNIDYEDLKHFTDLISDIPNDIDEIDIILHSRGGYMLSARQLVELLRARFKVVNFLIPFQAYSAAAMMCMSGDEIIMTPEASLSPFDVQMLVPGTNEYYPATQLKIFAKEARRANNIFNPFVSKSYTTPRKSNNFL